MVKSVSWTLAEFRHNRIVQSPQPMSATQRKVRSREHDNLCFLREKSCQSVNQATKLFKLPQSNKECINNSFSGSDANNRTFICTPGGIVISIC